MFASSLLPVVYRRVHVLFPLFVLFLYNDGQLILCCVFALFVFALFTLCCQFLWIFHFFLLPFWYSLTFIYYQTNFVCLSFLSIFLIHISLIIARDLNIAYVACVSTCKDISSLPLDILVLTDIIIF